MSTPTQDNRQPDTQLTKLAGDGSGREFYRIQSPTEPRSQILMKLTASEREAVRAGSNQWVNTQKLWQKIGIPVPKLYDVVPDGDLIVEDLGDEHLEHEVNKDPNNTTGISQRFDQIFAIIVQILDHQPSSPSWLKSRFSAAVFSHELNFFRTHFLPKSFFSAREESEFANFVKQVASQLHRRCLYMVHRDLHSRNILVFKQRVVLIDFQDARLGPPAYDLVSLCFDPYLDLTTEVRLELFSRGLRHFDQLGGLLRNEVEQTWRMTLIQRLVKILGSFAYLTNTQQRGDYLRFVPRVLQIWSDLNLDRDFAFGSRIHEAIREIATAEAQ